MFLVLTAIVVNSISIEMMPIMIPAVTKRRIDASNECEMCGENKVTEYFDYISPLSRTHLIVCKKCAIREYYGSSTGRRWKSEQKKGKLFGTSVNNY